MGCAAACACSAAFLASELSLFPPVNSILQACPPPPLRTKWTRRVPQPVLIGHALAAPSACCSVQPASSLAHASARAARGDAGAAAVRAQPPCGRRGGGPSP